MTQPYPLTHTISQLHQALEELHTVQEELRRQNEELTLMRDIIEAERQRYQELFEFAPDGYLVTNENAVIQEANQAAAQLLNRPKKYLVGKPLSICIAFGDRKAFRSLVNRLKLGQINRVQEWDVVLQPRNQPSIQGSLTVAVVSQPSGTSLRWMVRDISRRKQAEEQVQKIQLENIRLQETAHVKSQVLSMVSHDLRTPLNAILGFSQLLLQHPQHRLSDKQQNMVEKIYKNGENLLALVNDILDFSRVENHQITLKLEAINLEILVHTVIEEISSLASQKNLYLQAAFHWEDPVMITDRIRLRQVLVNLIANAIKFTETGGVKVEGWQFKDKPDQFILIIRDTGIGIAPEHLETIFEAFHQIESGNAAYAKGTGLGLSITKSLVELMQGTISVQSKVGEGSSFRVELPCKLKTNL